MSPRIAIIGSCVTRDVWHAAGRIAYARKQLLYVARTSFASLFAKPFTEFALPEPPPPGLSGWELRMIGDDLRKTALQKLADYRPTHLILELVDERFDLLRLRNVVVTHSWDLQQAGLADGPLRNFRRIPRLSEEASALWASGVDQLAAFLRERLPETRVIFHDVRWATDYVDLLGQTRAFEPALTLWQGVAGDIAQHNELLGHYSAYLRAAVPTAFHVRAPQAVTIADESHRWGLQPYHFTEPYYRYIWDRFDALGCTPPDPPQI